SPSHHPVRWFLIYAITLEWLNVHFGLTAGDGRDVETWLVRKAYPVIPVRSGPGGPPPDGLFYASPRKGRLRMLAVGQGRQLKPPYSIISKYPEAIAALFAVINGLWLAFTYFNGQRHARELEHLRHSLHLDAERRKKVFEVKVNQYEAYVTSLDAF